MKAFCVFLSDERPSLKMLDARTWKSVACIKTYVQCTQYATCARLFRKQKVLPHVSQSFQSRVKHQNLRSILVQSDLNVNAQMWTKIDLNECEHFLKVNWDPRSIQLRSILVWMVPKLINDLDVRNSLHKYQLK